MSEPEPIEAMTPRQERFGRWMIRHVARWQAVVYQLSKGRWGRRFLGAGQVGLLTFTGRRSGRRRTVPLVYARDGERVFLAASQGGMSTHPMWYHSLRESPEVWFQIGAEKRAMRVREVDDDAERQRGWRQLCAVYPAFDEYRRRAALSERAIPLLALEPAPAAGEAK